MKIAVYQGSGSGGNAQVANLDILDTQAQRAASAGARLLIAPEMFLSGYNIGPARIAQLARPAQGEYAERIATIARRHRLAMLYGYPERSDNAVYNAAQLISAEGDVVGAYRKTHLFGDIDRLAFSAGNEGSPIVAVDGMKVGILICYDIEFPENARNLMLAGADLIAVPTALMTPYHFIARSLVNARAYENQVFLAYANRCGEENGLHYIGQSCIVGPDGTDLARAGDAEELIVATLDPELLQRSRRINTYRQDRRPSLYSALTSQNDHTRRSS